MTRQWWWAALVVALGCRPAAVETLPLTSCRLDGVPDEAQCGTLEVPENPDAPDGRRISLRIARIRALAPRAKPDPIFILAGGPGQAATEVAQIAALGLSKARRQRDLVFVDQRGTGHSHPIDCEEATARDGGTQLQESFREGLDEAPLRQCLSRFDGNAGLYTTPIAMNDLDRVRAALGYERINLFGGSYGTRAALVYLRQHPDHARSAVLDGVAPLGMSLPVSMAKDGDRALRLVFQGCAAEPSCARAFPDLANRFERLLQRLQTSPPELTVAHPLTGEPQKLTLRRDAFTRGVRGLLYVPERASLLPYIIDRADKGDFAPFVASSAGMYQGLQKGISLGMFFSVICAEDAPAVTDPLLRRETEGTFLGEGLSRELLQVCRFWPHGPVPAGYWEPVASDAPVLLLSGELDPVTPPSRAAEAAKTLPHSLQLTVPGVGHGAAYLGCMPRLISDFYERGSVEGLDPKCLEGTRRPPFVVDFAGPPP